MLLLHQISINIIAFMHFDVINFIHVVSKDRILNNLLKAQCFSNSKNGIKKYNFFAYKV